MQMTEIEITNILPTKTAFAVTLPDGVPVFIPGRVADRSNIRVGQRVPATLIPNTSQPEKTPWMASYIAPQPQVDELAEAILEDMENGPATALEVAESIGQDVAVVARKMKSMAVAGKLVREDIYALSMEDLLNRNEEE